MNQSYKAAALGAGGLALLLSAGVAGHYAPPRKTVIQVVVSPSPVASPYPSPYASPYPSPYAVVKYTSAPVKRRSQLAVRADCMDQATRAWPDDSTPTGDQFMDTFTDGYTSSMRQKAFEDCMRDNGYPQN